MSVDRLILINPNTRAQTTRTMTAIAQEAAGRHCQVDGYTVAFGPDLIVEPQALAKAADAVSDCIATLAPESCRGIIVAAFGDPGLLRARAQCRVPVTGIAEAGMAEAAAGGRRFSVVTTTTQLVDSISDLARDYGHGPSFLGVKLTGGDPVHLMTEPQRLVEALYEACEEAIVQDGAQAIVIGGGPLAVAARTLQPRLSTRHAGVALIEPIPAAVRLAIARAQP